MLQIVQRNLAGGGPGGARAVSQSTSLAQGEDSRGQAGFSHRNGNKTFRTARQTQEPEAVVDGPRFGRDLHGIDSAVRRRVHASRQIRRALKIVDGEQDTRRHGIFPNRLAGKLAQGFYFEIPPLAAGFAGLNQPTELAVNAPCNLASSCPAGRDTARALRQRAANRAAPRRPWPGLVRGAQIWPFPPGWRPPRPRKAAVTLCQRGPYPALCRQSIENTASSMPHPALAPVS